MIMTVHKLNAIESVDSNFSINLRYMCVCVCLCVWTAKRDILSTKDQLITITVYYNSIHTQQRTVCVCVNLTYFVNARSNLSTLIYVLI